MKAVNVLQVVFKFEKCGPEDEELEVPFFSFSVQVPSSSFSVQNETVSAHGT